MFPPVISHAGAEVVLLPTPISHAGAEVSQLYETHQYQLLAYLTRLTSDREAAEDLCQESFIKALRAWDARDPLGSPTAWLYRIATNTAYDYLRRRRRIRFTPLNEGDYAPGYTPEFRVDELEPVQNALRQIPPMYRLPLVLHSCEGHSTQEIATALGCSNSAVKTRLFRARERFRQVYQG